MRIIDADEFKNWLMDNYICYDHTLEDIDKQPTIDAEPVRHGHWEITHNVNIPYSLKCSECGELTIVNGKYCPHCGAKMDEVEE